VGVATECNEARKGKMRRAWQLLQCRQEMNKNEGEKCKRLVVDRQKRVMYCGSLVRNGACSIVTEGLEHACKECQELKRGLAGNRRTVDWRKSDR
jgi:hypothetical protein